MQSLTPNTIPLEHLELYAALHIGLSAIVCTALIATASLAGADDKRRFRGWLNIALATFIVAGALGGLVAGHIFYITYQYPWSLYKAAFFFMYFLSGLGLAAGVFGLWRAFRHEKPPVGREVKAAVERPGLGNRAWGVRATPYVFRVVRACADPRQALPREVRILRVTKGRRRKVRPPAQLSSARVTMFRRVR